MKAEKLLRRNLVCPAFESLSKQTHRDPNCKNLYKTSLKLQIEENHKHN